jgi:hypothetical protein
MSQEYPNTGGMWKTKEKRHEKSPDMWGELKIDPEYLRELIADADGLVTVKIDAWKKTTTAGNTFLSLKINTWKPEGQASKPSADNGKDPWDE